MSKTKAREDADLIYDMFVTVAAHGWEGRQSLYERLIKMFADRDARIAELESLLPRD